MICALRIDMRWRWIAPMSPPLDIFCPMILPLSLTYCLRVCHSKAHALPEKTELGLGEGVEVIGFATSQSAALFGHIGIGREHPDFFCCISVESDFGYCRTSKQLDTEISRRLCAHIRRWHLSGVASSRSYRIICQFERPNGRSD